MRTDPDIKFEEKRASSFNNFKKGLAIIICFIMAYFFLFKIIFF